MIGYRVNPQELRHRIQEHDLFGLNLRDELRLERCNLIRAMWPYLEINRTGNSTERDDAEREIDRLTRPGSPHANCARCFRSLYLTDLANARRCYEEAGRLSDGLPA